MLTQLITLNYLQSFVLFVRGKWGGGGFEVIKAKGAFCILIIQGVSSLILQINVFISNSQPMTRLSSLERHLKPVCLEVLHNKRHVILHPNNTRRLLTNPKINISISNSQSMTRLSSLERRLTPVYLRVLRNKRHVITSIWPACFFRYQAVVCCSSVRFGNDIASAPSSVVIIGNKRKESLSS